MPCADRPKAMPGSARAVAIPGCSSRCSLCCPRELSVINLRVDDAVTASLAAARTVQRLLPRLRALGGFEPDLATRVKEWAYVLNHVNTQANLEPARYRFPAALIAEAKQLRSMLLF